MWPNAINWHKYNKKNHLQHEKKEPYSVSQSTQSHLFSWPALTLLSCCEMSSNNEMVGVQCFKCDMWTTQYTTPPLSVSIHSFDLKFKTNIFLKKAWIQLSIYSTMDLKEDSLAHFFYSQWSGTDNKIKCFIIKHFSSHLIRLSRTDKIFSFSIETAATRKISLSK